MVVGSAHHRELVPVVVPRLALVAVVAYYLAVVEPGEPRPWVPVLIWSPLVSGHQVVPRMQDQPPLSHRFRPVVRAESVASHHLDLPVEQAQHHHLLAEPVAQVLSPPPVAQAGQVVARAQHLHLPVGQDLSPHPVEQVARAGRWDHRLAGPVRPLAEGPLVPPHHLDQVDRQVVATLLEMPSKASSKA